MNLSLGEMRVRTGEQQPSVDMGTTENNRGVKLAYDLPRRSANNDFRAFPIKC
ncbi:unnamed protein product [Nesidiocoris tenuis]|uniref:Uncharacterized protein n=1 Tax=Nesidiocoris tenuis TaxID=355587 RepID=A0A6H5H7K8_9HEMI|nr:unnamed protein product [Nesidiocoris tenuis]